MKTIYLVSIDSPEMQAMFDDKGEMLGKWSTNEAAFDIACFSGFLKSLDITVEYSRDKKLIKKLNKKAKEIYND